MSKKVKISIARRLKFLGAKLPFVVLLSGDISIIEDSLLLNLSVLTSEGFRSRDLVLVASCLYSYQAIGKAELAEEIFRTSVVDRYIDCIIEKQYASNPFLC